VLRVCLIYASSCKWGITLCHDTICQVGGTRYQTARLHKQGAIQAYITPDSAVLYLSYA